MKTIYSTLLLLCSIVTTQITFAQLPNYVPTSGLIAWYPFNGTAIDLSSNSRNGSITGATPANDRFGSSNQSFYFDGFGDSMVVTLPSLPSFSFNYWIKCGPTLPSDYPGVYNFKTTLQNNRMNIISDGYPLAQRGQIFVGDDVSSTQYQSTAKVNDNQWHMITVIYDYSGPTFKMYLDSTLLTSKSISATSANFGGILKIGNGFSQFTSNNPSYDSKGFVGFLDDIGVWNRALNQSEIGALYNSCVAGNVITVNPTNKNQSVSSSAVFSVTTCDTSAKNQWQTNPVNIGWINLVNGSQYTGVSTSSLNVNNISVSNHNQKFRVVSTLKGCTDTSTSATLNVTNMAADSMTITRLKSDSARLTNDSILSLSRINALRSDTTTKSLTISKLKSDTANYLNQITNLRSDSVSKNITINKLKSDTSLYLSQITILRSDSINKGLTITKLRSDSIQYIGQINSLRLDSALSISKITYLKSDTTNKGLTIHGLKNDTTIKGNQISSLKLDTTNMGMTIRQLQFDLANKHDTVFVSSIITSDTLVISITTGISPTSGIINALVIYPNPASNLLHIDLKNQGYFLAKITGITGQTIITPTSGTIDISSLASGTYSLSIFDVNNKLISVNKITIIR